MAVASASFYKQVEALAGALPPLDAWDPPLSGDMDCRIATDGNWFIDGSQLENDRLLRLFSTVLRREDNDYFLVTPVEKWRIQVDDLPFLVVELEVDNRGEAEQLIRARTNVGDWVTMDAEHPPGTSVIPSMNDTQRIPYIHVRDRLAARFNRTTYMDLADLLTAVDGEGRYTMSSGGTTFNLDFGEREASSV